MLDANITGRFPKSSKYFRNSQIAEIPPYFLTGNESTVMILQNLSVGAGSIIFRHQEPLHVPGAAA
jgi:hypothetical protein